MPDFFEIELKIRYVVQHESDSARWNLIAKFYINGKFDSAEPIWWCGDEATARDVCRYMNEVS